MRALTEALGRVEGIITPYVKPGCRHVFHQYTIMLELEAFGCTKDEFVETLRAENIDARSYYPIPMHQQPVYLELAKGIKLPVTEEAAKRVVSLPVHPALSCEDLEFVVRTVEKVVNYFLKEVIPTPDGPYSPTTWTIMCLVLACVSASMKTKDCQVPRARRPFTTGSVLSGARNMDIMCE